MRGDWIKRACRRVLERRSVDTSASVRGQKVKRGVLTVDVVGLSSCMCGAENWLLIGLVLSVKNVVKSSAVKEVVGGGGGESWMLWRACVCQMCCWSCCGSMKPRQYGLQQRKMKAKTDRYLSLSDRLICAIFSAALSLERCSRRTSDNQGLEGAARAGLEERGQIPSRQEVKVEIKCSVHIQSWEMGRWGKRGGQYRGKMWGWKGTKVSSKGSW